MIATMTPEGFEKVYEIFLTTCKTYTEAYNKAEEMHVLFFGTTKYSDIDCFRMHQKRARKNKK